MTAAHMNTGCAADKHAPFNPWSSYCHGVHLWYKMLCHRAPLLSHLPGSRSGPLHLPAPITLPLSVYTKSSLSMQGEFCRSKEMRCPRMFLQCKRQTLPNRQSGIPHQSKVIWVQSICIHCVFATCSGLFHGDERTEGHALDHGVGKG